MGTPSRSESTCCFGREESLRWLLLWRNPEEALSPMNTVSRYNTGLLETSAALSSYLLRLLDWRLSRLGRNS
jgi:hypothetical protein